MLGGRLGQEVVDSRFRRDRCGSEWIVAGDHHGADAHLAQLRKALADAALDDVFQMDRAENPAIFRHGQRRAAGLGDTLGNRGEFTHGRVGFGLKVGKYGVDRALADGRVLEINAAHARLRRERHEFGIERCHLAAADAVLLLGEHDDGAAFRGLVAERGELRRIGQLLRVDALQRQELGRLAVSEGDGASLVQEQRIHVARRLDRAARHGEHIEAHQPVHAGDADGGEQRADGGGDETNEQRNQHDDADRAAGIRGKSRDGDGGEDEDDGHAHQQDVERDLVGGLLPDRAFDKGDHAIEEGRALRRRDLDPEPIRGDARAARDRRTVASRFTDNGRGFSGDGGFVNRGHALDYLAVARDVIAGFDQHDVARLELGRVDQIEAPPLPVLKTLGLGVGAHAAQAVGLGLAATLGHRLGEIGE